MTPSHAPTRSRCIVFYYSIEGRGPSTLNVYMLTSNGTAKGQLRWSSSVLTTRDWNYARVSLSSPSDSFKVVFEAVLGASTTGMISIDDVVSQDTACKSFPTSAARNVNSQPLTTQPPVTTTPVPSVYDCTFEGLDFCKWSQATDDQFDWQLRQVNGLGSSPYASYVPTKDHTKGTSQGAILLMPVSVSRKPNETAGLISPTITPTRANCLTFWYRLYGPENDGLQVYYVTGSTKYLLWKRQGTTGSEWRRAMVQATAVRPYQWEIVAVRGTYYTGSTAIDDIHYSPQPCPHADFSPMSDCDFEMDYCGFTNFSANSFNWTKSYGKTQSTYTGPSTDHTYGTDQGHYLYVEASSRTPGSTSSVLTPTMSLTDSPTYCLRFFYHMYGSTMGELRVHRLIRGRRLLWKRSGDQGQAWVMAEVSVQGDKNDKVGLEFEGVIGSSYRSDIAIDDLSIRPGPCDSPGACSFESGDFCTWRNDVSGADKFDWAVTVGNQGIMDNTIGDFTGHYAILYPRSPLRAGDKAMLVSEAFVGGTVRCFNFHYNMQGSSPGSLSVYVRPTNTIANIPGAGPATTQLVWRLNGQAGPAAAWYPARVKVTSPYAYNVILEGSLGQDSIRVDDLIFTSGDCAVSPSVAGSNLVMTTSVPRTTVTPGTTLPATPFDCNFEDNLCGWSQDKGDQFDWTRAQGPTGSSNTGPLVDHTKGTNQGWYVFIEASSPQKENDTARLISSSITAGQRCLRFFYTMAGSSVYQLNVYVKTGATLTKIFSMEGEKGPLWLGTSITINPKTTYQIVIEGVRGKTWAGDIAIDDITMPVGACPEISPEGKDLRP
ncbi:MAM and LDL-receptor class A domain-containing protein 1 [Elysia marginata]|uniref:MAM and LDL-receptor class A domain-containing protein 1 n=1 Tax=Elysia marginata TaxID=1093978 RepID=A0AAV4FAR0_9GAST|nr:MAM and LDL-receptor class A domain-containing protein 1 [Elysia marginata]